MARPLEHCQWGAVVEGFETMPHEIYENDNNKARTVALASHEYAKRICRMAARLAELEAALADAEERDAALYGEDFNGIEELVPWLRKRVAELGPALRDCLAALGGCARPYSVRPCGACVVCRGNAALKGGGCDG